MSGKKYEKTYGKVVHWYGRNQAVCNRDLEEGITYLDNIYITNIIAGNREDLQGREAWISIILKKVDPINTENIYKYIFLLSVKKEGEKYVVSPVMINYVDYYDVISYIPKSFWIKVPLELNNEDSKNLYEAITEIAQKCVKQNLRDLSQLILRYILSKVEISGLIDKE